MNKKILLPAMFLILALTLSACGSGSEESNSESGSKNAVSVLNAAIENVEKSDTYKIDGTIEMTGMVDGQDVNYVLTMNGQSTYNGSKSQLTLDMTPILGALTGSDFLIETRIVDGFVYTKTPNFVSSAETWTKQPFAEYATDENSGSADPTDFLVQLNAISKDVTEVGKETINDQETTRYSATITQEDLEKYSGSEDLARYYDNLDLSKEAFEKKTSALANEDLKVDIWINADNQIARIQFSLDSAGSLLGGATGASPTGELTTTVTFDFSDWGQDFEVEIPDESLITDQQNLQSPMSGLNV